MSRQDALAVYERNHATYENVNAVEDASQDIGATIVLLAACQDFQVAADGDDNGAFTSTVLEVSASDFNGTYSGFLEAIKTRMYHAYYDQIPNYLRLGSQNDGFEQSSGRPFALR